MLTCETEVLLADISIPCPPLGLPAVVLLHGPVRLPLEILAPVAVSLIAAPPFRVILTYAPFKLNACGTESPVIL